LDGWDVLSAPRRKQIVAVGHLGEDVEEGRRRQGSPTVAGEQPGVHEDVRNDAALYGERGHVQTCVAMRDQNQVLVRG
jgi:hypothetical protein